MFLVGCDVASNHFNNSSILVKDKDNTEYLIIYRENSEYMRVFKLQK